jgi:hypothetical protein
MEYQRLGPNFQSSAAALSGGRIGNSSLLIWHKSVEGFALHRGRTKAPILHVVHDSARREMWRVRDARLIDLMNLSPAKGAAIAVASDMFDPQEHRVQPEGGRSAKREELRWHIRRMEKTGEVATVLSAPASAMDVSR